MTRPAAGLHGAEDYASPIEPSGRGGAKIARAIAQVMGIAARLS